MPSELEREALATYAQWDQILGHREDGRPWRVPGLSILYYAGEGLFCYSHDLLNMRRGSARP